MLGPYIAGRLRNKDSSATLDSSSPGSEEMGRTEPPTSCYFGKRHTPQSQRPESLQPHYAARAGQITRASVSPSVERAKWPLMTH